MKVFIEIPLAQLRENTILLHKHRKRYSKTYETRQGSAYINLSASKNFDHLNPENDQTKNPSIANVQPVLQLGGFVLESSYDYQEFREEPWHRKNTTLTKDYVPFLWRWTAGDISTESDLLISSRRIGGLSLSKAYLINPYLNTKPESQYQITLEYNSVVEIWVNNRLFRRLRLKKESMI